MYWFPIIYVSKLTHITFKRDSYLVIFVSWYPEALVEAFLRLQVFAFVFSGDKTCLYSKGILWMRAVTFSATHSITQRERFSEPQEFWTEEPYSTPFWGLTLHTRTLPIHEISHINGAQDVWIQPTYAPVLQGLKNYPVAPRYLCSLKHETEAKQLTRWEVHALIRAKSMAPY